MHSLRTLEPAPGVLAFYAGRDPARRFAEATNWVEADLALGTCSYAVVDGAHALVYDTHLTLGHAREVRRALEGRGVREFTVVLSHWHLDHIAGTEAFADCEIVANERTARLLSEGREAIESGTKLGAPPIAPLILPTRTFAGREALTVGATEVELHEFEIHSSDATVMWLPGRRLLLAGDTVEDTVTFVDEPGRLEVHLAELERLGRLGPDRILPSHGDPGVIAAGGYGPGFIVATRDYVRTLLQMGDDPELAETPLREVIAGPLSRGALTWHPDYEEVHRRNVAAMRERAGRDRA